MNESIFRISVVEVGEVSQVQKIFFAKRAHNWENHDCCIISFTVQVRDMALKVNNIMVSGRFFFW